MSLCVHMFLLPFLVELFVVLDSFSTVVVVLVWKKRAKNCAWFFLVSASTSKPWVRPVRCILVLWMICELCAHCWVFVGKIASAAAVAAAAMKCVELCPRIMLDLMLLVNVLTRSQETSILASASACFRPRQVQFSMVIFYTSKRTHW